MYRVGTLNLSQLHSRLEIFYFVQFGQFLKINYLYRFETGFRFLV